MKSFKRFLKESAIHVKPGAFHAWLGKSPDEPITAADIAKGKAAGGHAEKMAIFAQNFGHHKEESLDEASPVTGTRIISKHGNVGSAHHAEVRYNSNYQEYSVHHYAHGKHMGEGPVSYHGNDKEDATNTAEHEVKRFAMKEEKINEDIAGITKVGDHVHLGFGAKGGAGFRGHVIKVEKGHVFVQQHDHDAVGNKYGPKVWKGPIRHVTVEKPMKEDVESIDEETKRLHQVVDSHTGYHIGKPHSSLSKAYKKADKLDLY